jgi:hypothetical protein
MWMGVGASGKTQTSQRTEKIVILSGAGTSRSEVSAESKDPYQLPSSPKEPSRSLSLRT